MRTYISYLLPCIFLIIGIILHVLNISTRPVWFDEAASLRLAHAPTWGELLARSLRDVHPPLFYFILKSWVSLTAPFGPSHIVARVFTTIINLAFLYSAFIFTKESVKGLSQNTATRLIPYAAVAYLLSSQHILEQAWSARMYGLAALLLLTSNIILLKILDEERPSPFQYILFSLLTLLAAFTHYIVLLSVIAQGAYLLCGLYKKKHKNFTTRKTTLLLACLLPTAIEYLTWAPNLLHQFTSIQKDYWSNPFIHGDIIIALGQLAFPSGSVFYINAIRDWWVTIILVATVVFFTQYARHKNDYRLMLLSFVTIIPFLFIFFLSHAERNYFQPRALSFIWPTLLIIVAIVVGVIQNRGLGILAFVFSVSPLALHLVSQVLRDYTGAYGGTATAARVLMAQTRNDDVIVVTNPLTYLGLHSYLHDKTPVTLVTKTVPADHWQGGAFLREGEAFNEKYFSTLSTQKLWFVHSDGYQWKEVLVPPKDWIRVSHRTIPERLFYQGTITIEELIPPTKAARASLTNKRLTIQETPWRYTFSKQPKEWKNPGFTDSEWDAALGSFGNPLLTEFNPKNSWITDQLWLRKETTLPSSLPTLSIWARYVGTIEVHLNGEQAAVSSANAQGFRELCIPPAAAATLRPGINTIAVQAFHHTSKGFVDVTLAPSKGCSEK